VNDDIASIIITIISAASGIVVTMRGFSAARAAANKANDNLRTELMQAIATRTVSLDEYKPKIRELHELHNAAREKNIALENKTAQLERDIVELKTLLVRTYERIPK